MCQRNAVAEPEITEDLFLPGEAHSPLPHAPRREGDRWCRASRRAILHEEMAHLTDGTFCVCSGPGELPYRALRHHRFVDLVATGLPLLRQYIWEAAYVVGMTPMKRKRLVVAASEAAQNAIVHGRDGTAYVLVTAVGTVQVWVQDSGPGIAGLAPPTRALPVARACVYGEGFEAMQSVDHLWLLSGEEGTTVLLEQRASPVPSGRHCQDGDGEVRRNCRVSLQELM